MQLPVLGGVADLTAQVGACQRADCQHNDQLECRAPAIRVGPDNDLADCITYDER
ncbi:hypothetical protein [Micromonospora avicenniae]|uniref:hypothetical protein n=1 Tax=Micromonospora avicenniae TaxID=1198245 RepID=UPI0033234326